MTSVDIIDHAGGIAAIIAAFGTILNVVLNFINNRATIKNREFATRSVAASERSANASAQSIAVSERNSRAIAGVQDTLHNGIGEKIAAKAIEHIVPALREQAATAAVELKEVALAAATELKAVTKD